MSKAKAGWNWLYNSRKWHYFKEDGRSLCGRFMTLGLNTDSQDYVESTDNCAACVRQFHKLYGDNQRPNTGSGHNNAVDAAGTR